MLACVTAAVLLAGACAPTPSKQGNEPPAIASPIVDTSPTPPLPGWFAFTAKDGDLWVIRGDGSDRRQVTLSRDGVDTSPTWAQDASRLAYRHSIGVAGGPQNVDTIRIVGADGSGARDLVEGSFPAWSPDGAWIAFRGIEGVDLAVIKPDGSGLTPLGVPNAECPVWSPDGRRILYCRNEDISGQVSDNWEIWVMNRDGSGQHQLTNDPSRDYPVAWSSDGSRILFFSDRAGNGASFVMDADGSGITRVTDAPDLSSANVWLPDGRFIVASASGDTPSWFVLDSSGARNPIAQLTGAFVPIAWTDGG